MLQPRSQIYALCLLKGSVRDRVARRFLKDCCNNEPSGYGGSQQSVTNLEVVRDAFARENIFAWVYEKISVEDGERLQGRWCLGARNGTCVGALVWARKQKHIFSGAKRRATNF